MYEIENGVPFRDVGQSKYPFRQMEEGDSCLIPCPGGPAPIDRSRVSNAISAAQRATGWRFSMRTVDGGLRVWMVS